MKKFFTKSNLFALAFSLLGLFFPAELRGQAISYVGLSTVSATVANGATCTGSAQNFTTSQGIANFINIGQTSHLATATSNAVQFQMEIDGIDNVGNVYRLSPLQLGVPTSGKGGLVVTASGYMTKIQISVTCTAGATFTIAYTGSFSPTPPDLAGALLTAIDKLPFQTAPANANASQTFQSPTGNSAGTVIFQYAATGPSGSTITVQCLTNSGSNLQSFTFFPGTGTAAQFFNVTPSNCPFQSLTYTSGGASATTYNLEYVFNASGTQSGLTSSNSGSSATSPMQVVSDTLGQSFVVSPAGTITNPVSGQVILHLNANNGTRTVYFDRVVISASAAATVSVNATTSLGTTCSGTSSPLNEQMPFTGTSATSASQVGPCTGAPGSPAFIIGNMPIAAGSPVTLDLRGLIAKAGSTTGVDVTMAAALTGTVTASFFWYEK